MTSYLVTGGAGFIGSNIVRAILPLGHHVRVLDNLSTGHRSNLVGLLNDVEFVEGDLRDPEILRKAAEGIEIVLHQAALPSVSRSIKAPLATHEVNVTGTLNLLIACLDANVRRIVYASSSSVYGNSPTLPKQEGMSTSPCSPYAVSKVAAESYCQNFSQVYGLETICLRYFNVFGPYQDPLSEYSAIIPRFITRALAGEPLEIYGSGQQSRDFTFVDNVVQANLLAATTSCASGQTFNIACGTRHTILDLLHLLQRELKTSSEVRFLSPRPGDVHHSMADISKAREMLGYEVQVPFEIGIEKTIEWYSHEGTR